MKNDIEYNETTHVLSYSTTKEGICDGIRSKFPVKHNKCRASLSRLESIKIMEVLIAIIIENLLLGGSIGIRGFGHIFIKRKLKRCRYTLYKKFYISYIWFTPSKELMLKVNNKLAYNDKSYNDKSTYCGFIYDDDFKSTERGIKRKIKKDRTKELKECKRRYREEREKLLKSLGL